MYFFFLVDISKEILLVVAVAIVKDKLTGYAAENNQKLGFIEYLSSKTLYFSRSTVQALETNILNIMSRIKQ